MVQFWFRIFFFWQAFFLFYLHFFPINVGLLHQLLESHHVEKGGDYESNAKGFDSLRKAMKHDYSSFASRETRKNGFIFSFSKKFHRSQFLWWILDIYKSESRKIHARTAWWCCQFSFCFVDHVCRINFLFFFCPPTSHKIAICRAIIIKLWKKLCFGMLMLFNCLLDSSMPRMKNAASIRILVF